MKIRARNPNPNRFDTMTQTHLKAVLFDVCLPSLSYFGTQTLLFRQIGGVVVQSPLLAVREYEIEHGVPHNYINCLMYVISLIPANSSSHRGP